MKYIDIHAHLNFSVYKDDLEEVKERMKGDDVYCANVGTKESTSKKAVELTIQNEDMYAFIGLHPIHTNKCFHDEQEIGPETPPFESNGETFNEEFYQALIDQDKNKKIVGVGECGLDYFHISGDENTFKSRQKMAFEKQIEFALKNNLPLMIHCRDAYGDVLNILEAYKNKNSQLRGNVHFFSGDEKIAKRFLDIDFTISFTGVITFAKQYFDLVRYVPIGKIHAETDCPYVAPAPYRGQRNEPSYVMEVVKKMAEIKQVQPEILEKQLVLNWENFIKI